jgi:hypothetical protein
MTVMAKVKLLYLILENYSRPWILTDKKNSVIIINDYIVFSAIMPIDVEDSGWSQIVNVCFNTSLIN